MRAGGLAVVVAFTAATLSGCLTSPAHTSATPESTPTAGGELRGTEIEALTCRNPLGHEPGKPVASLAVGDVTGDPSRVLVCGPGSKPLATLTPHDGDRFSGLIAALSLPNLQSELGSSCANVDYFFPYVVMATSDGIWFVAEPRDGSACGAPRQEVIDALKRSSQPIS